MAENTTKRTRDLQWFLEKNQHMFFIVKRLVQLVEEAKDTTVDLNLTFQRLDAESRIELASLWDEEMWELEMEITRRQLLEIRMGALAGNIDISDSTPIRKSHKADDHIVEVAVTNNVFHDNIIAWIREWGIKPDTIIHVYEISGETLIENCEILPSPGLIIEGELEEVNQPPRSFMLTTVSPESLRFSAPYAGEVSAIDMVFGPYHLSSHELRS